MGSLNTFDLNVYSDELFSFTEEEYAAVLADAAHVINQQHEKDAWKDSKKVSGILIKKACEHPRCGHYRCESGLRIGGIEI